MSDLNFEHESGYRVAIVAHDYRDPLSNEGRIVLFDRHTRAVLMRDGTWKVAEEGTALDETAGYLFPLGALGELAQAIDQYLGRASHTRTEVAVLREWLAHEIAQRAVADTRLVEAAMPPRFVDLGGSTGPVLPPKGTR